MPDRESLLASRFVRVSLSVACIFLGVLVLSTPYKSKIQHLAVSRSVDASPVYNRTLGFQKVYGIGFSSRSDKRDALSVASSLTEFDITWNEGVRLEDIPDKAIPEVFENVTFEIRALGCWRAHLNVLRRMVDENIQTAILIEDDADWDVTLKSQLAEFARGATALQREDPGVYPRGSPYGNNWDHLWFGHCHVGPADSRNGQNTQKMYFISNDTTVPPWSRRGGWWDNGHIIPEVLSNTTRIVLQTNSGMCTQSYAITLAGARKVLTTLSLEAGIGRQIDGALSVMIGRGDLRSYSVYPKLIGSHVFAGSKYRDSDIHDHDQDRWHDASTGNIVYSTVMNALRLVMGGTDVLSQWPNETIPVRSLGEKYSDQVSGELRDVNLRAVRKQYIEGLNSKGRLEMQSYHDLLAAR